MSSSEPDKSFNPLYDDPPPPPRGGDPDTEASIGCIIWVLLAIGLSILSGAIVAALMKLLPNDEEKYPLLYPNPMVDVSWWRILCGAVAGAALAGSFYYIRGRNPVMTGICLVTGVTLSTVTAFVLR